MSVCLVLSHEKSPPLLIDWLYSLKVVEFVSPKLSTNARAITSEGTVFWYCRCVEAASLRGTYGELRRC